MNLDSTRKDILFDVAYLGLKLAVGSVFMFHGIQKFDPATSGFFSSFGIPLELQIPIALAESIAGILLIIGILNRVSAALLAVIILGGIFYVKHAASFSGPMGVEFDVTLLASILLIIAVGPGRISISGVVKNIPRPLR